jgi:parallel beta-helix repeat protein
MPIQLANNASGTLATAISASDTGLALTTGDGAAFPALGLGDYFYATITSSGGTQEIVKATARSGDSLTIVRAQESTVAQSFAAGSRFELRVTAQSIIDTAQQYAADADLSLRVDLAAATGSSLVGFQQAGSGTALRTVQAKLRETVSVKDFGAVGDGVTNDSAAIQSAIASSRSIFFPAGNYLVTTLITINATDIKLHGVGAASKITSATLKNVIRLATLNRAVFEDLAFETTVSNATENVYGVVWAENDALKDVSFLRCHFFAPNANTNGVKIINQDTDISDQVRFIECRFEGIQRMGIEWQNHVYDGAVRYRSVTIERCTFKDIGVGIGYGFAISLSGLGENCTILNNTFDNIRLGIELVGANDTTAAFNKFRSFAAGGKPFSFGSAFLTMYRNRIIGNTMEAAATGDTYIWQQQDLVMHGNYWHQNNSEVIFRDVVRARISDDQYDTSGVNAVFIEGTSADNQFVNCRISNQRATSSFSAFRTFGATVTDTWLIGCYIRQGTGGVLYDAQSGAQLPRVYLSKQGTGPTFLNDIIRQGLSYKTAIRKTAGSGVSATSITIDFGASSSWIPAHVSLRVNTVKNDSSGAAWAENRIFIRHLTGIVIVANNQVIGTASNLTVTTSATGNVLTITCTHATTSGPELYFMWDVEVASTNEPIVA